MKDITVITISSDNRSYLGPCLDALQRSNNGFSFDIVVVDNDSKDGSAQFVKERYPDINLIEGKTRQGFSFNNNLGIKKSDSRYILLLNVDTVIEPGTLKIMLKFMEMLYY